MLVLLAGLSTVAVLATLAGCPSRVRAPAGALAPSAVPSAPAPAGRRYRVSSEESLLTVLVYRAGALAQLGHNHVIASRAITGTLDLGADAAHTYCQLAVPVASFTVDEPALRAAAGADFPPDVPQSAREGTQRNMLGEALLDAAHFADVAASCEALEGELPDATRSSGMLSARMRLRVRTASHALTVPLTYARQGTALQVTGSFRVQQSELGLTPFSAMLGALRVQDEITVQLRLALRPAD